MEPSCEGPCEDGVKAEFVLFQKCGVNGREIRLEPVTAAGSEEGYYRIGRALGTCVGGRKTEDKVKTGQES